MGGDGVTAEPIAIVGMACRLPQADGPAAFWRLLHDGTDALTEAPEQRWPSATLPDHRRGGFITDVDQFDAAFFGISPKEAAAMDPQQRLILELAWEALENARIAPTDLHGTAAGVFVAAIAHDYNTMQDRLGTQGVSAHSYTGTHRAIIANRVSYFLRLQGPSLTIDTGQSSSLVAVQLACESLRRGESRVALAGGVNLNLLAETTAAIARFGALSPDGHCHVFDERANGYVRGEGAGLVVLKPLSAALKDGDVVQCVILGGAVNNDGGGDGLTSPSQGAQQDVIELACARAGIAPADVQYVEVHGSGTRVGDPIEAAALGAALGADRTVGEPLLVGSVKTNIGHLEGAAGIAGLLKVALSLSHREVPASLNFRTANPLIPLDQLGLQVVQSARPWPRPQQPLVAGVSSFGMGGTNCHLVLGEAPATEPRTSDVPERPGLPWVLSARSAAALRAQAQRLLTQLTAEPDVDAAEVALALLRTRAQFEHRAVISGSEPTARLAGLAALAAGTPDQSVILGTASAGQCAFTFPGQGSQWLEMARDLLDESVDFAARIADCAAALAPFVDYSLVAVLRGAPGAPNFDRVDVVQPALWAVMVSLAEVWRVSGVEPDLVVGHSQGEIAAATVIGALSLSDGARVVALRSRAIAGIAGTGGMMSVAAPRDVVEAAISAHAPQAGVAAVNSPGSIVVSGPNDALAELQGQLTVAGYRTKIVPVDYASHSAVVEQLREELLAALAPITPVAVATTFISTLTGEPMDTAGLDADYWYRSLRHPVEFEQATRQALAHDCRLFVECSPHPVLVAAVEETLEAAERDAVVLGTLRRAQGGSDQVRRALAEAYVGGATVDWIGAADVSRANLVDLPTYPFQRSRHWLATPAATAGPALSVVPAGEPGEQAEPPSTALATRTRRELCDLVIAITADALGHESARGIGSARTFKDLGVDSVTAVDVRNRLRAATGLTLPTGLLFDYPSPDQLADHLCVLVQGEAPPTVASSGQSVDDDPIVIVSMGCRFPGDVTTPEQLWDLVASGSDASSEFPVNRGWDVDALFATGPERSGTSDTRRGGFLHDADQFDAAFFGISPREALAMDPQQRVLLEICWEALERGGLDPFSLRGSPIGVFVGAMAPDYGPRLHQSSSAVEGHLLTGTALSVVSGRIAYTFGLEGPAVSVDTACSSSLVAIHLAVQALRRGECSLALAGGVTVMSSPGMFVEFSRQSGLSTDGQCKAFAASADGTGWAEGAGVVLLQRLSDARRDGREVLAVVRGSAVNQDGRSNGMTAPNGPSQERVIRQALADAGLAAGDVDAVEAHGTGTTLGDPIEADALLATYGQDRVDGEPLWLGSLKSNLGHTQAAAGVAGVIKMVQAMRHGLLPATLHAEEPSPHVDWSDSTVSLLNEARPWTHDRPLRAGVSSFGISGTNGHVILEQAPETALDAAPETPALFVWAFSARSAAALRSFAERLGTYATDASIAELAAASAGLAKRARFEHRAVVIAADREQLLAGLAAVVEGGAHPGVVMGVATDVAPVFVFPGQGSQWVGMAVELLECNELFWEWMCRCDGALAAHIDWSVLDVLRGEDGALPLAGSDVIQPVLFAVMVSLAALWRSAGVEPVAVLGHSQGEIAAACAAGALSLEDAAKIVALRSKALMKLTGTGGMLSVALPAEQVAERIAPWAGRLWTAILGGPFSTVVAGAVDAIDEFAAACGDSVQTRRVAIDYAAHTPHIENLRDELLDILAEVKPHHTDVAFCSSSTGAFVEPTDLIADYWYDGLRNPVQFAAAVRSAAATGTPLFIEVSPHPMLTGDVHDTLRAAGLAGDAIGSLRRGDGSVQRIMLAAAQAFVRGATVNWSALLGPSPQRQLELPTYPFDRTRYWLDGAGSGDVAPAGVTASRHPLLGAVVPTADGDGYLITGQLSRGNSPWLTDHAVAGAVLLPGTAFVELALEAAAVAGCDVIEDLALEGAVFLPDVGAVQVQLVVRGADDDGRRGYAMYSRPSGQPEAGWTRHASGTLGPAAAASADAPIEWPPTDAVAVDLDDVYGRLADLGYDYGPAFQGLTQAWRSGDDAYLEVALPDVARADASRFTLHPALLDAALHILVLEGVSQSDADAATLLMPFAWAGVSVAARGADALRVRISGVGGDQVSLAIYDSTGRALAEVAALSLRRVPITRDTTASPRSPVPYAVELVEVNVPAVELTGARWAIVGDGSSADDLGAVLRQSGVDAARYYDLPSLAEMSAGEPPAVVLVPYAPEVDADDVPYSVREGIYGALDLVQTWVGDDRFAGSRLVFVTTGATGDSLAATEAIVTSPLWGLVRSAQAEHPGRFVLTEVPAGFTEWGVLTAVVADGESQVLVRDGRVLVPRLVRRELSAGVGSGIDAGGTVLVTGGTGSLGAVVAERLVTGHGVRQLVLLSRRGPQAEGAADLVVRLAELGAQATVLACDVGDRDQLAAVLDQIPVEYPLTGVVHAAGVVEDATVDRLSTEHLDTVFAPKLDGAWHLHELTADVPLSMFVLFSSLSGVLGNAGQGNYAAANVFLDALATHRHGLGLAGVSVAWGLWDAETGMSGALSDADVARLGRSGIAPLSVGDGLDLFDAALSSTEPLVVAAGWDLAGLRARAEEGLLPPVLRSMVRAPRRAAATASTTDRAATGGSAQELTAHLSTMSEPAARRAVVDLVRAQVAAALGHATGDAVDVARGFSELGFDSLTVVELRNRLDVATGLRLPATLAFDYPTVTALVEHLLRTLAPVAPAPEEALRIALDRMQEALPDHGEASRGKVIAILHSTLARLGAAGTGTSDVQETLSAASDHEIFAFIDSQL